MDKEKITDGTVHKTPKDLQKAFNGALTARMVWQSLTPLARNEWICWTTSVNKRPLGKIMSKGLFLSYSKLCVGRVAG